MPSDMPADLVPGVIVSGPLLPEPAEIIAAFPMGTAVKIVGKGLKTAKAYDPVLSAEQLTQFEVSPVDEPFDGDPLRFRLGIEAARLSQVYECDPFISLSISRIGPVPHQLEAVNEYFLSMPRIRFLLADDPGTTATRSADR